MTKPYQALSAIYDLAGWGYFAERMAGRMRHLADVHGLEQIEHVVDVACGTGIAVAAFAEAGYQVTGVDRSPYMLDQARQRVAQADATSSSAQSVTLIEADMRDFSLPEDGRPAADLVTCMYDSLNYLLEEADLAAAFRCVADVLRPGGLYIFDVNTLYGLAEEWNSHDFIQYDSEDLFIAGRTRWDHERAINTLTFHGFIRLGEGVWERFLETHVQRGYPIDVLRGLLEEAGLAPLAVYDAGRRSGPDAGKDEQLVGSAVQTGRVLIVAQKRGTDG